MKHNFKMLGWGKVLACSLMVLASVCLVFVLTKLNTKTYPIEASLKKELIHHEVLTPLSNQVNDYLDNDSEQDPFRLDFSLVDTTTLGTVYCILKVGHLFTRLRLKNGPLFLPISRLKNIY